MRSRIVSGERFHLTPDKIIFPSIHPSNPHINASPPPLSLKVFQILFHPFTHFHSLPLTPLRPKNKRYEFLNFLFYNKKGILLITDYFKITVLLLLLSLPPSSFPVPVSLVFLSLAFLSLLPSRCVSSSHTASYTALEETKIDSSVKRTNQAACALPFSFSFPSN